MESGDFFVTVSQSFGLQKGYSMLFSEYQAVIRELMQLQLQMQLQKSLCSNLFFLILLNQMLYILVY